MFEFLFYMVLLLTLVFLFYKGLKWLLDKQLFEDIEKLKKDTSYDKKYP